MLTLRRNGVKSIHLTRLGVHLIPAAGVNMW